MILALCMYMYHCNAYSHCFSVIRFFWHAIKKCATENHWKQCTSNVPDPICTKTDQFSDAYGKLPFLFCAQAISRSCKTCCNLKTYVHILLWQLHQCCYLRPIYSTKEKSESHQFSLCSPLCQFLQNIYCQLTYNFWTINIVAF